MLPGREDALHGYADLSGVVEAAFQDGCNSSVEIKVVQQDYRRRAAVFECAAGTGREFASEHPADLGTANETEKTDAAVCYQLFRSLVGVGNQCLAPAGGKSGLAQQFHEPQAGKRCIAGGFDDDRAASRNGWCNLVNDQIQRVIECADCHDNADRFFLSKGDASHRCRRRRNRNQLARMSAQGLDAKMHAINRTRDLDQ